MAKEVKAVRKEKVQTVDELANLLSRSTVVVLADYRGLTVSDIAGLRKKLREQSATFQVAKNTLLGFAADKAGRPALRDVLVGPTGVAFGEGDAAALARAMGDYERTSKVFKVKGAMLGERILDPREVTVLASLPGRDVLLGQVVAGIQSPIAGLVGVLGGLIGGLVGTLEARRQQLEEQGAAA